MDKNLEDFRQYLEASMDAESTRWAILTAAINKV